jgi:hypothetical protein
MLWGRHLFRARQVCNGMRLVSRHRDAPLQSLEMKGVVILLVDNVAFRVCLAGSQIGFHVFADCRQGISEEPLACQQMKDGVTVGLCSGAGWIHLGQCG